MEPPISVIVPAFNAEANIRPCIEAIVDQCYTGAVQIIVVDNLSTDKTKQLVAELDITLVVENKRGSAAARNRGVEHAIHDVIVFTDSDCIPDMHWLSALAKSLRLKPTVTFHGGQIRGRDTENAIGQFASSVLNQRDAIEKYHPPYIITANVLIRRDDLVRIGLFDETFIRGQDSELAFRGFFKHKASFTYCHDAIVTHHSVDTLSGLIFKGWQHGRGSALLWQTYQDDLGTDSVSRARQLKAYFRFLNCVSRYLLVQTLRSSTQKQIHTYKALIEASFEMGKQAGFSRYTLWSER